MDKPLKNGQKWDPRKTKPAINGSGQRQQAETTASSEDELGQIDDVIGNFGRYQFLIFMFKILIGATSAFNNLGVTFFAPSDFISFRCADSLSTSSPTSLPAMAYPMLSNSTHTHHIAQPYLGDGNSMYSSRNYTRSHNIQTSDIFEDFIFSEERRIKHSYDLDYNTPKNLTKSCKYVSPVDNREHKCTSFQYDTGIWISTIIDEWDLVCDRAWFISLIQALYMSGFIISYLVFGYLSDRFGRWRTLLLGAFIEIMSGFGCALSNSVAKFMIFRLLLGLGNAGRTTSAYLIMIEWVGPKWRMHISTLGSMGWLMGYCTMPWLTLYFLHFRHMQLFVCFYEIIFVIWLLFLPESPRWLLIHKRYDEAYEVLLTAARFNGLIKEEKPNKLNAQQVKKLNGGLDGGVMIFKTHELENNGTPVNNFNIKNGINGATSINDIENNGSAVANGAANRRDESLQPYTIEEYDIKFQRLVNAVQCKDFTKNENKLSCLDLFRWENLRRYALILFFVWAANSFIYYGIALRVGDFGGKNLFIAFSIAGITELPSMAFTILCMKFLPRRTTNLFIFTITAFLCVLQIPLKYYDYQNMQQFTMMMAKLFNSCSFTVILYQTMELFPTSIRQTAYSSCSLAGRIGSILAPFIKELAQKTNNFVPPIMYALLSLLAALFIKDLPETRGSDIPDTLLEAENFQGTDAKQRKEQAATIRCSS